MKFSERDIDHFQSIVERHQKYGDTYRESREVSHYIHDYLTREDSFSGKWSKSLVEEINEALSEGALFSTAKQKLSCKEHFHIRQKVGEEFLSYFSQNEITEESLIEFFKPRVMFHRTTSQENSLLRYVEGDTAEERYENLGIILGEVEKVRDGSKITSLVFVES